MTIRAAVRGVGHYLPDRIVPNSEFEKTIETSDEWIRSRSGIERRHFAAEGQTTSDLATRAARAALDDAGLQADDIDAIIVATSTADLTFPSGATVLQAALGMTRGFAFDVQAVCAGFVYALANANALIIAGQANRVLVIGAETFSRILDWTDRTTCVLFGDGAGAVVLRAETVADAPDAPGILVTRIRSDGRYHDKLYVDGGPSTTRTVGQLRMEGREVFKHAVINIASVMEEAMAAAGVKADEIDWFVPHQANRRILEGTARKLGIREDRIVITLDRHGNTSAASIPLAFDVAVKDGRIRKGDLVLFEAMGGGFTWGAVLVRY